MIQEWLDPPDLPDLMVQRDLLVLPVQREGLGLLEPLVQQARRDPPAQVGLLAQQDLRVIRDQPEPQDLMVQQDPQAHKALPVLPEQQDPKGRKVWYGKVIGSQPQSIKLMTRSFTP